MSAADPSVVDPSAADPSAADPSVADPSAADPSAADPGAGALATPRDVTLIAALDEAGIIGRDGGLPWRLPDDLRRFRRLTMGKPMIMGRRTHASIGRALPGRRNLVLSRDPGWRPAAGCERFTSLDAALAAVADAPEVMVIGGRAVYAAALPRATRLELTWVHARVEGDVRFPPFDAAAWQEVAREEHPADACHAHAFTAVTLVRGPAPRR